MPAYQGQRDFHRWDIEGKKVKGVYLGKYEFTGVVQSSRVKYGGVVQHWIKLDEPMILPYDQEEEVRTHFSIDDHWDEEKNELLQILD